MLFVSCVCVGVGCFVFCPCVCVCELLMCLPLSPCTEPDSRRRILNSPFSSLLLGLTRLRALLSVCGRCLFGGCGMLFLSCVCVCVGVGGVDLCRCVCV